MSAPRTPEEEKAWIHAVLQRYVQDSGQQLSISEPETLGGAGNEFISTMFTVVARGPDGDLPLVVKIMPRDPEPNYSDMRHLCRNESLFYKEFLPFLLATASDGAGQLLASVEALFPKFFYSHEDASQCLLAIENLTPLGFKFTSKVLDFPHVKLMLRELGVYHALSYIAKKRKPDAFSDLVKRFYPWDEDMCRQFAVLVRGMFQNALESFRAEYPRDYETHTDLLAELEDTKNKLFELTVPEEPLAVLCHGDYNRNNVLFKYDESGKPTSMKLFDFQLATYSSPAIDVSLVLFLSTSPEVLDNHWDEFIYTYQSSLLDTMVQGLNCPRDILEKEYSPELLMKDFKKFCLHGFIITTFFMPVTVMSPEEFAKFNYKCPSLSSPEFVLHSKRFCNTEANNRLAALFKILIERVLIC